MNTLQHALAQPRALWLLAALPALSLLALLAGRWRRWAMFQFAHAPSFQTGVSDRWRRGEGDGWRRSLRRGCAGVGLACLILGIAGPQWGRERNQSLAPGRDFVIVLDMSLSMLARDVPGPTSDTRLGQAVSALRGLADAAEKRGGHRLALVVFASRAKLACPLTQDYDHFRKALEQLDPLDPLLEIGPVEGSESGTRIGLALMEAAKLIGESPSPGFQDILLLSDGDDPAQDEEWRLGVNAARKGEISIHTIGLGDPSRPSPIPIPGSGELHYHGLQVTTRLDEKPLESIAVQTGGTYTSARTNALPMADWLSAGRELHQDTLPVYIQRYDWFFGPALAFLTISLVVPGRRMDFQSVRMGKQGLKIRPTNFELRSSVLVVNFLTVIFVLAASPLSGAEDLLQRGNAAFGRGDYGTALGYYRQAEGRIGDPGLLAFNEAAALYKLGRYREAEIHYWLTRQDATGERLSRVLFDLGNAVFQQAGSQDGAMLQRAIGFYGECLSQSDADPELLLNAQFNLQLARERLKKTKSEKENPSSESKPGSKRGDDSSPDTQPPGIGAGADLERDAGTGQRAVEGSENEAKTNSQNAKQQGGIGNLPPVPDTDQLTPLNSFDTSAYLKKAAERILSEQRAHHGKSAFRPSQNLKDW